MFISTARLRGHAIYWDGAIWRYVDNDEPTVDTWLKRNCGACGLKTLENGHDPCIPNLPGVLNACCGHGVLQEAYVMLSSKEVLSGEKAVSWMNTHTHGIKLDAPSALTGAQVLTILKESHSEDWSPFECGPADILDFGEADSSGLSYKANPLISLVKKSVVVWELCYSGKAVAVLHNSSKLLPTNRND